MATYYVSATAPGGGDGSVGNPWTLAEAVALQGSSIVGADTVEMSSGVYSRSTQVSLTHGTWIGAANAGTIIRASAGMTSIVDLGAGMAGARQLRLEANGNTITQCLIVRQGSLIQNIETSGGTTGINLTRADGPAISRLRAEDAVSNRISGVTGVVIINSFANGGIAGSVSVSSCVIRGAVSGGNAKVYRSVVGGAPVSGIIDSIIADGASSILRDEIGTPVSLGFDPFIDFNANDLRLSSAALSSSYANQLRAIMAGLVNVPGITTDPLSSLIGSGGGSSRPSNPFRQQVIQ
jgi:hypothetical protein